MKKAIFIPVKAKAGQEQALADFLTGGAQIVINTEPKTLYWFALQFGDNSFGIIDFFADQSGLDAHFGGKVAAALNENASNLVEGGWDEGVIAGIVAYDVLAIITQ